MDVSRHVLMTLILHFLTSHPLKQTLILAKSLTSDPYNRGLLKRRKSVVVKSFEGPVVLTGAQEPLSLARHTWWCP